MRGNHVLTISTFLEPKNLRSKIKILCLMKKESRHPQELGEKNNYTWVNLSWVWADLSLGLG